MCFGLLYIPRFGGYFYRRKGEGIKGLGFGIVCVHMCIESSYMRDLEFFDVISDINSGRPVFVQSDS